MTGVSELVNGVSKTTDLVAEKGYQNVSAGVIILIAIIFILIFTYMFKTIIKNSKEERKDNKALMERMMNIYETNMKEQSTQTKEFLDKMVKTIDIINTKQDEMKSFFKGINEGIINYIDISSNKVIDKVNGEKELTIMEFEKQSKIILENCILRIKEDLENKIEKNDLVANKLSVCGTPENKNQNSELYLIIKKQSTECKDKIKALNFKHDSKKECLFNIIDDTSQEILLELSNIFDVKEGYIKAPMFRQIKNISDRTINSINELNFGEF